MADDQWARLTMPARVDIASHKSLAGGQAAADRATALGKDPVTVWPHTTHSLPIQAATDLGLELQKYWTSHDR